jgi:hypothetical protein
MIGKLRYRFGRQSLVVLTLALALVTAGCAGGGVGGSDVETDDDGGVTADGATTVVDGDEGDVDGDVTDGGDDDGENADDTDTGEVEGDVNGATLRTNIGRQENALREAGSFTVRTVMKLNGSGADEAPAGFSTDRTTSVDLDAGRVLDVSVGVGMDVTKTVYYDGTDEHQKLVFGAETASNTTYVSTTDESDYRADTISAVAGDLGYAEDSYEDDVRRVGTETYDGVSVTRYEAGLRDLEPDTALFLVGSNVDLNEYEVAYLVDADGIVRYASVVLDYDYDNDGDGTRDSNLRLAFERSVTDVGSTTVDEPDWLDRT